MGTGASGAGLALTPAPSMAPLRWQAAGGNADRWAPSRKDPDTQCFLSQPPGCKPCSPNSSARL